MAYHEDWCYVWNPVHEGKCCCDGIVFGEVDLKPLKMPTAAELNQLLNL